MKYEVRSLIMILPADLIFLEWDRPRKNTSTTNGYTSVKIIEMGIHSGDLWGRRAKFKLIQVTMVQFTLKLQVMNCWRNETIKPKTVCWKTFLNCRAIGRDGGIDICLSLSLILHQSVVIIITYNRDRSSSLYLMNLTHIKFYENMNHSPHYEISSIQTSFKNYSAQI